MTSKKDPGKFTVRFNVADPQQREVVEILDQQGRCKAQFLTNAVLHYIHCTSAPDAQRTPVTNNEEIERIVRNIISKQQTSHLQPPVPDATEPSNSDFSAQLNDSDKSAIWRTMQDFRQQ